MKANWGWMLAGIAMVCLLWSLVLQASMNLASSFEQHSVACFGESRSPSSYPSLRVLREGWIRGSAGPPDFFFRTDVLWRAEDLDATGPPWLDSCGPPGRYRDPGRRPIELSVAKVATAAHIERGKLPLRGEFSAGPPSKLKIRGYATRFS